jgi:Fe-S oxidoreductase
MRVADAGAARFDFPGFFQDINVLADLELEERLWLGPVPEHPTPHDVVLYLGCNVLKTAHLIPTVLEVFRRLGVDVVAVGGPATCCGTIHHNNGEPETGWRLSDRAIEAFARFRPEEVVLWCPSCNHHFQTVVAKERDIPLPMEHVTEFLVRRIGDLELAPVPKTVALHAHGGLVQQEKDARCAEAILRAIPGLTLVPSPVYPELGVQCSEAVRRKLGEERFRALLEEYAQAVAASGAQVLATLYHACHRNLCGMEARYPFVVQNYISILGEALGITYDDAFKRWTLSGDEETIYAEVAERARAKGISEARARGAIRRHFVRG